MSPSVGGFQLKNDHMSHSGLVRGQLNTHTSHPYLHSGLPRVGGIIRIKTVKGLILTCGGNYCKFQVRTLNEKTRQDKYIQQQI